MKIWKKNNYRFRFFLIDDIVNKCKNSRAIDSVSLIKCEIRHISNEIFVILKNLSYICNVKQKNNLEPAATDKRHKIMTTTNNTENNNVTILSSLAVKCGEALVAVYNNGYETRALSCNKVWFRSLYNDLKALGCERLIALAKGSQEIKDYGFKDK